jgi:hypothetical protein
VSTITANGHVDTGNDHVDPVNDVNDVNDPHNGANDLVPGINERVHAVTQRGVDSTPLLLDHALVDDALNEAHRRWPGLPLPAVWVVTVLLLEGLEHAEQAWATDQRHVTRLPATKGWKPGKTKQSQVYRGTGARCEKVANAQWPGIDGVKSKAASYALKVGVQLSQRRRPQLDAGAQALAALA